MAVTGKTKRIHPVFEVSLLVRAYYPVPLERAVEGDIVNVRLTPEYGGTGKGYGSAETSRYLKVLMDGLELNELSRLKDVLTDPLDEFADGPALDKRRFCIPFHRLKQVAPWLDLNRVVDRDDPYQPFCPMDEEDGSSLHRHFLGTMRRPLNTHGLIYDKAKMRYL